MMVTLLGYEILMIATMVTAYDSFPSWAKAICLVFLFAVHIAACISEDKLRGKINKLEDEVKELKKGDE